ncbi:MAG: response regulator [Acidimicrobiia bacterium]
MLAIGLPQMDGYEIAKRLRAEPATSKVLLIALSYGQEQDRQRTHGAGFDHHLVKPVAPDKLEALLAEHSPEARTAEN